MADTRRMITEVARQGTKALRITARPRIRVTTQRISLAADALETVAAAADRSAVVPGAYTEALMEFARAARALAQYH